MRSLSNYEIGGKYFLLEIVIGTKFRTSITEINKLDQACDHFFAFDVEFGLAIFDHYSLFDKASNFVD